MPTRSQGLPHAFLSLHSLYSFLKNVLSWIDSSTSQLSVYNVCFIWSQTSRRPKHLFAKQAFGRVFADSITRVFKNGAGGMPEYSVFFGNYRNIPFCVRKLYKTQGKNWKWGRFQHGLIKYKIKTDKISGKPWNSAKNSFKNHLKTLISRLIFQYIWHRISTRWQPNNRRFWLCCFGKIWCFFLAKT